MQEVLRDKVDKEQKIKLMQNENSAANAVETYGTFSD